MLTFDEPRHEYRWDGIPVPNVTRIIAPLTEAIYQRIPHEKLERARQEGKHVHKMVELYFTKDLKGVPSWMEGHHRALLKFEEETGFECLDTERKVYHPTLRYAGTLDLRGRMKHLKGSKHIAILDVKRSFYAGPAIGLQTSGYEGAANTEEKDKSRERYALQLNPNGTYRLKRYDNDPMHREDNIAFLACLQQLRWKEKHYGHEPNAT